MNTVKYLKNFSKTIVLFAAVATLSFLTSSCSQTTSTDAPPQLTSHSPMAQEAPMADTLAINNKSSQNVTVGVTIYGGPVLNFPAPSKTSMSYQIPSAPIAVAINGIQVQQSVTTPIFMPDGSKVYVNWTGNNIIVGDTLELN